MAPAGAQDIYTSMQNWKWSPAEKAVARKAFERALEEELQQTVADFKSMAARISDASELWDAEGWLARRRKAIDEKYDYRYSVLPMVFGRLLREGRVKESDLQGLGSEKLEVIRNIAQF